MDFGVYLVTQTGDGRSSVEVYRDAIEMACVAEEAGFTYCFVPEHHQQPDGYLPSPFVLAGAIAARTSRIKIMTGIHLLPLWHPMRTAEDVAVVDVISQGRITVGIGLGLVQKEFDQFGIDMRTVVSRFKEQVEILKRAWGEAEFSFDGDHFSLHDVSVTPRPVQEPRPPLYIGAMSDGSVARAGEIGDGWLTDPLHSTAVLANWAALFRAQGEGDAGKKPIWLQRDCWVTANPSELEDQWGRHLLGDWRFYWNLGFFESGRFNPDAEPWIRSIADPNDIEFDAIREDRVMAGSPEEVVAAIREFQDLVNPTGICSRFRFPSGPSHAETLNAMRLFGEEVIPHFDTA